MLTESLPIQVFIRANLERREVKAIIDNWRVDYTTMVQILTNHFMDMGWYEARPEQEKVARETLVRLLKSSSELIIKVNEAERRERMLARTKKSFAD
jgi:hypothetical protein